MAQSSSRVLVAGNIPRWLTMVRNLSIVAIFVGMGLGLVHGLAGGMVFSIAVALTICLQIIISARRRTQRWITDTGSGFVVEDRSGRREYEDDDIYALDFETQKVYSQGVLKGIRRIFRVKVQDEPAELEMRNLIAPGEVDPLSAFVARTVEQYRERASEALAAGATVSGKNWSLTSSELSVQGKSPLVLPLDAVAHVGIFDAHVCVWKRGEHDACLRIPVRSKNAFLLQQVLAHRIGEQGADAPQDEAGLGRVLFQRKGPQVVTVILAVLALALGGVGVFAVIGGIAEGQGGVVALGVGVLLLVALGCGWGIRANHRTLFRCHERGVYNRGALSETQLRYEDVDEFTYSATRQYYNGAYIGTALKIVFKSQQDTKPTIIKFSRSVKNADEELDELSDHVARVVGSRMLQKLAAGERVKWTDALSLTPEGIEYRAGGFVGRKPPVLLPYNQVSGFNLDKGVFYLWETGKSKAVMNQKAGATNFLPGYAALQAMYSSRA